MRGVDILIYLVFYEGVRAVLKGLLSLFRQFLLYNKSQNIKELICWANTLLVRNYYNFVYLYTQPTISVNLKYPLSILLYIYYYSYSNIRINKMPLKAAVTTILGESDPGNNISIAGTLEPDLQVVTIGQLRSVIEQINIGQVAFNNKLKDINAMKVKLLEVK